MPLSAPLTQLSLDVIWARRRRRKELAVIAPALFPILITVFHPPQEKEIGLLFDLTPSLSFGAPSLLLGYSPPFFPGDTASPVVPAKQAEQVGVPKTMHREKFGAQANNLFQWEKNAALKATQTGEPRASQRLVTGPGSSSNPPISGNLPIWWRACTLWKWQCHLPEMWEGSRQVGRAG